MNAAVDASMHSDGSLRAARGPLRENAASDYNLIHNPGLLRNLPRSRIVMRMHGVATDVSSE